MNNKTFLSLHGVIYAGFAFALFFLPTVMWPMYGVEINDKYAYFLSQHTSIFLGGIAAITWLLRDIEPGVSAKKLIQACHILIPSFFQDAMGFSQSLFWSVQVL